MKFNLNEAFGVEDGVDFNVKGTGTFRIIDNVMLRRTICNNSFIITKLSINEFVNKKITIIKKIEISEDAEVVLRNIDKKFKWIAMDLNGEVYFYTNKPSKKDINWCAEGAYVVISDIFGKDLFSFLSFKDEEPILIKDLLNNKEE